MHLTKLAIPKLAIVLTLLAAPAGIVLPRLLLPPALAQTAFSETAKARQAEADHLFNQGLSQFQTGGIEPALQSWQQALTIYRALKDRLSEGKALGNLGIAYRILGDFEQAIASQQQYLTIARELKDRESEGMALGNLGNIYYFLGQFDQAIAYQQQWLAIARETKDRQSEGKALGNLGNVYESLGDYAKTIDYTQQWLAIARETKDRQSEGKALGNLGVVYHSSGDYGSAIMYGRQQLAIAQSIKDRQTEGAALGNLGNAYYALGEYDRAIAYEQKLLTIARDIKDIQSEAAALGNLGNVYLALGQYDKAADYQQQQLAIVRRLKNRQSEAIALGNLSTSYFFQGDDAKTVAAAEQSLAIAQQLKDRLNEGRSLGLLGNAALVRGDAAKAIAYHQQQLAIARAINARRSEGTALNNLGYALLRSGNPAEAERTLFAGIKLWESLRAGLGSDDISKVSLFDEQARTYRTLQEALIAQNKPEAALEIAERGRARAFVEILAQRLATETGKQAGTRSQPATIPVASPSIAAIKQIAKAQNATLVQYAIIYSEFAIEGKQRPREDVLYLWVIQPTGAVIFRSVDLKPLWQQQNLSLKSLVANSRAAIGVRSRSSTGSNRATPSTQTKPLQQLYQLLIQPIADQLPTDPNQRIVFMPQGALFLVPFPALQDTQGKYLIEQHTLQTAPSIQVLGQIAALTQRQEGKSRNTPRSSLLTPHSSLVVGNPTMPRVPPAPGEPPEQLAPLPGAEKEAIAIAPLLQTKAITGKQATKAAIVQKMSRARIIHLATHGLLDEQRGLGSALALAPDASPVRTGDRFSNGLLTAAEILNLPLNADLVVLSACDTGRGRITGDGVIGLSRSFIAAGVPNLIVSLWAIPDAPTATVMTEFYRNLRQSDDKAQALRQAMLTTMKTHPDPRDWAAFTLIGEAE